MSVRETWEMICPTCKDDESLKVAFKGTCRLTGDGTEDDGDHEWDSTSECSCDCGWSGTVDDAELAYQEWRDDHCDECDADLTDGEGYDGLCGSCADAAEDENADEE